MSALPAVASQEKRLGPGAAGSPARRGMWMLAIALVSSSFYVALVSQLPLALLADASHDDAWFWQRAERIASGDWMGGYDGMTLMKGAGYPLFLALAHGLGVSSMTAQALLYATACLLLGLAVQRVSGRAGVALVVVLALQWHPAALAWARLLRDAIGAAQLLLVVACLLLFSHAVRSGESGWRWALVAGWALGWLWSTREDGIWVVPGLALLVLVPVVHGWRDRDQRRRLAGGLAVFGLACAGWLALVATVNLVKYGVFATVETRDTRYADAMSALQGVRVGEPVARVPVPRTVREAVFAESPAFARLRPYLEGPGMAWSGPGCGEYPDTCGDFAGGWWMWALRDGAGSIGEYQSASTADAYYGKVADEVAAACGSGRLTCARNGLPGMPPTTAAQWHTLPDNVRRSVSMLLWQGIGPGQTESDVASPRARAMWEFLGRPRVPDPAATLARVDGGIGQGIPPSAEAKTAYRSIKRWIGLAYGGMLPALAAGGLLAFCWAMLEVWRARQRLSLLHGLAAAAWTLAGSRMLMLALVQMASFPAIHVHYMQPAYPMLLLAALVSLALLAVDPVLPAKRMSAAPLPTA